MALSFSIKLQDEVSPGANKAASSLYRLDAAIKNEGAALRVLQNEMRAMAKAGDSVSDKFKSLNAQSAESRNRLGALKDQLRDAGGMPKASSAAGGLEAALGKLAGGLDPLVAKSGRLGQALSALGPYGIAAAAGLGAAGVAAFGFAGALVYLESKLIAMGIAASEAKGDTMRSLELLYGGQKAAEHTYKVLESLTGDIAISQERVLELSDSLIKAGQVNGDAMVASIAAIGKAEAARKGAGKVLEGVITRATSSRIFSISRSELMQVGISYKELSKEIAKGIGTTAAEAELRLRTGGVRMKQGLEALNKVVDAKMGDLAAKKFQTVGAQTQLLHDNFARLFEGADSTPFARALMAINNSLSESSVSGAALREIVKSAFQEISSAAETVAPYLQTFFEGAILLALKLYNALYPVRQAIARMFGGDQKAGLESFEDTIINFADNVGKGFSAAALAIAWMIDNAKGLAKVIETLIASTPLIGPAFTAARATIKLITSDLGASNTKDQGKNVAQGVANGIQNGTPAVEAAMAAMAMKGTAAFDAKMGIKSPSTVMQLRGAYIDQGLGKGVNDNADEPAKAMADTSPAIVGAARGSPQAPTSAARGGAPIIGRSADGVVVHCHFASGAIVIGSGSSVADAEDQLTELMANVFEKANAMRAGGA